jgi:hypothetical protein
MAAETRQGRARRSGGIVKSPHDLGAGVFLIALAALGYWAGFNLPFGQLSSIGSGLLPRVVSFLVGAFGIFFVVQSLLRQGDRLEPWGLRSPLFVLAGIVVFALTIQPWGLVVAGPLAVIISSFAERESKVLETSALALAMTLFCGLLFKELLNLPIPFDPAGIIPERVFTAYVGAKGELSRLFAAFRSMLGG